MKYDDASWHYGGEFPEGLSNDAGATHIGMFLAWALLSGMGGELFAEEEPQLVDELRSRSITPGQFFLKYCDGKFIDEDLSELGIRFTEDYFELEKGGYLADYEQLLQKGLETLYHVPDTWESYDKLSPAIDARFAGWRNSAG
jgi:hypothetical protein